MTTSRLLRAPEMPVFRLGQPTWDADDDSGEGAHLVRPLPPDESGFKACNNLRIALGHDDSSITIGEQNGLVAGVIYDVPLYRQSGHHIARKLRYLLAEHGKDDPLHRLTDNGSAMLYTSRNDTQFAVYAYLSDIFIIHSTSVKLELR